MTQVRTDLRNTRESARELRFEPVSPVTQTNVQKAIEQLGGLIPSFPAATNVTSGSATISSTASEVFVNFAGAVTLTLPDAATWKALALFGQPLRIMDYSGAASTNNITINRAGANLVDNATSITITADYGAFSLRVDPNNNWIIVG